MKLFNIYLFLCFTLSLNIQAQTTLLGIITDDKNEMEIPFADVILYKNEVLIAGTQTDFDGRYSFQYIEPGLYDLKVQILGFKTETVKNVSVIENGVNIFSARLKKDSSRIIGCNTCFRHLIPLIDWNKSASQKTINRYKIRRMPTKNIQQISHSI